MADNSKIEWTDSTWNPITGCSVTSPGCTNCYAMRLAGTRLRNHPSRKGLTKDSKAGPVWTGEVRLNEEWLTQPLQWKRSRKIFVCAHGDLFHENVPDDWIDRVFAAMALAPQHTFQVLTKRSARMRSYFESRRSGDPWAESADEIADMIGLKDHPVILEPRNLPVSNVWLGISAEDQRRADERIPDLLATPAAVRFVSAEPLLGPVDLTAIPGILGHAYRGDRDTCRERIDALRGSDRREHLRKDGTWNHRRIDDPDGDPVFTTNCGAKLDWVIVGGESGPGARPMHPDWARSLRDQCASAGVSFMFKQWGIWVAEDQSPEDILLPGECREFHGVDVYNVPKKAAGRLLDGVEHNGMPLK